MTTARLLLAVILVGCAFAIPFVLNDLLDSLVIGLALVLLGEMAAPRRQVGDFEAQDLPGMPHQRDRDRLTHDLKLNND